MQLKFYKSAFSFVFSIMICAISFGQEIDSNNNSSNIGFAPLITATPPESDLFGLKTNNKEYKNPIDNILQKIIDEENKKALNNKGIIDPQKLHENRLKKEMAELNRQYAKIDQYLGGFSSTSKTVTIVCRDFQAPDGDTVTIYLNESPVVRNVVLSNSFQQFSLPLKRGLNVISFMAINQGSSGPNTAAFMVYDENGKEISSNEWNLATGAKATLSIARVEE
jgi:hypothetical protein